MLICINIFISYTRGGVMQFLFGYGLFSDVWAPISEIVINLSIAIICGSMWGLPGVLLGGITSQILIVGIWKPYFLFTRGFHESIWNYWANILKYVFALFFSWFVTLKFIKPIINISASESFTSWIVFAVIYVGIYVLMTFVLLYATSAGMRSFVHRFIKIKL